MVDPIRVPGIGMQPIEINAKEMRPSQPTSSAQPARSFKDVLTDAITEVQRLQGEADTTIKQVVSGEIKDVTQAMVAVEKADIAFQTMMTVRNKIVSAYEEIMRMQV